MVRKNRGELIIPPEQGNQSLADMLSQFPKNEDGDILFSLDTTQTPPDIQGNIEIVCYRYVLNIVTRQLRTNSSFQRVIYVRGLDEKTLRKDITQYILTLWVEKPILLKKKFQDEPKKLTGVLGTVVQRTITKYFEHAPNEKFPGDETMYRGVEARHLNIGWPDPKLSVDTTDSIIPEATYDAFMPEAVSDPETALLRREMNSLLPEKIKEHLAQLKLPERVVLCLRHDLYPNDFRQWLHDYLTELAVPTARRRRRVMPVQEGLDKFDTLGNKSSLTLIQIESILGITPEHIWQIEQRAQNQLRIRLNFDPNVNDYHKHEFL